MSEEDAVNRFRECSTKSGDMVSDVICDIKVRGTQMDHNSRKRIMSNLNKMASWDATS